MNWILYIGCVNKGLSNSHTTFECAVNWAESSREDGAESCFCLIIYIWNWKWYSAQKVIQFTDTLKWLARRRCSNGWNQWWLGLTNSWQVSTNFVTVNLCNTKSISSCLLVISNFFVFGNWFVEHSVAGMFQAFLNEMKLEKITNFAILHEVFCYY